MKKYYQILFTTLFLVPNVYCQNVGIGTSNPLVPLHIKGDGEAVRIQGNNPWIGFTNNTIDSSTYETFAFFPDTSLVLGSRSGTNMPIILAPNNNPVLYTTAANRVGIGTASPSESLDVHGSVNITGALKTNGITGSVGQVLMSTGNGLSWSNTMGFKKSIVFKTGSTAIWNVPSGVTEIMVELWGAGSGGTDNCGGTSGGYARTVQTVSSGYAVNLTVGVGSAGSSNVTSNGGLSSAVLPQGNIYAYGGGGVSGTYRGAALSGSAGFSDAYFMSGNSGSANISTFGMKNATTYVETRILGAGGAAIGHINPTQLANSVVVLENGVNTFNSYSGSPYVPGNGGGSGGTGAASGFSGADGMIVISWN